jgi:hypothetical protein
VWDLRREDLRWVEWQCSYGERFAPHIKVRFTVTPKILPVRNDWRRFYTYSGKEDERVEELGRNIQGVVLRK